jgi:hypothetical protein
MRLSFTRASKVHPQLFVLGGSSDHDSGGFVVSEIAENLRICIAERSAKVAKVRNRYPEWWLALEDSIGYGVLDEDDRKHLRELIRHEDHWWRHHTYFRRYGLEDATTMTLTGVLLFVVLFYVYPLKFLWTLVVSGLVLGQTTVRLADGRVEAMIQHAQVPRLFEIYGLGAAAVFLVFVALYLHAYRRPQGAPALARRSARHALERDEQRWRGDGRVVVGGDRVAGREARQRLAGGFRWIHLHGDWPGRVGHRRVRRAAAEAS